MPAIRPISDLRDNFNEISDLCHREGEPVFITRNGHDDLVVMSMAAYERLLASVELYRKLGEAEAEAATGQPSLSHDEMIRLLKESIDA